MSIADATRKELRDFLHLEKARPDGSSYTQPSTGQRRASRRAKNAVAKRARKANRGR